MLFRQRGDYLVHYRYKDMNHFNESFVKDCCQGDKMAQKRLFEELYAPMFRVCLRYVNHIAEAEDSLMKGFMKVFQNIEGFKYKGEHSLFVWTRRIMVNESLMFLRQQNNFMLTLDETIHDIPADNEILGKMNAEELNTLIMKLPTGYRTVFNLYVAEGYEHKEIAKMLGISENTSRTQLAKARNKLQIMLKQQEVSFEKHG